MKQVTLLAITLASSGVLAIPAPNIFDPIADAISNTLKKWEGSSCDGDCRTGFGWDGRVMGNDPWGMPLNPGMPAGYVAAESSQIVNVAPIPTDKPKPTTTTIAAPTSAPTLTAPPVVSSTSSTSVVSSAAPSSTDGVVKIFNLPAASSNAALAAPTDDGTFNVKDTPQPDPQPQPQPQPEPQPQPQPDPQPQPQPQPQPEPEPQPQPAPPPPPAPAPAPPSSNSGSGDIQQYLDAHNSIRRQHGASDLSWSDDLQGKAQEWANNCVFEHSGGKFGRVGENLAAGTGAYTIQQAVKDWTDEVSDYNPSNPKPSHFTQVVWKETTQVGCAVQTCNGIFSNAASYYVCEYLPAGNIIGHFGEQVQK